MFAELVSIYTRQSLGFRNQKDRESSNTQKRARNSSPHWPVNASQLKKKGVTSLKLMN